MIEEHTLTPPLSTSLSHKCRDQKLILGHVTKDYQKYLNSSTGHSDKMFLDLCIALLHHLVDSQNQRTRPLSSFVKLQYHKINERSQYTDRNLMTHTTLDKHTNPERKKKHLQDKPYASNQRYGTPKESTRKAEHLSNPMQYVSQLILLGGSI